MYINDNEVFPYQALVPEPFERTWYGLLSAQYLDDTGVFRCLSHSPWNEAQLARSGYQFDYVWGWLFNQRGDTQPSTRALVAGKSSSTPQYHYYFGSWGQLSDHHSGGANILYWGGHVEWHKKDGNMLLN